MKKSLRAAAQFAVEQYGAACAGGKAFPDLFDAAMEQLRDVLDGERAFTLAAQSARNADDHLARVGIASLTEPRTILARLLEVLDAERRRIEEGSPEALTVREPKTAIPVRMRRTHVVVRGDTVQGIAQKYGVANWRDIATMNRLRIVSGTHGNDHVHIECGWELLIPGSPT